VAGGRRSRIAHMRAKFVRGDIEVNGADPKQMEGNTCIKRVVRNGREVYRTYWKEGAVISHPEAYFLVRQGIAIPEDDECRDRANMSNEGMRAAQHAYGRLAAGIAVDDYAAYDAGYLSGYNPDGSWIPGPNGGRDDYEALFEDEGDDDDE
jgi:hypothetical protein